MAGLKSKIFRKKSKSGKSGGGRRKDDAAAAATPLVSTPATLASPASRTDASMSPPPSATAVAASTNTRVDLDVSIDSRGGEEAETSMDISAALKDVNEVLGIGGDDEKEEEGFEHNVEGETRDVLKKDDEEEEEEVVQQGEKEVVPEDMTASGAVDTGKSAADQEDADGLEVMLDTSGGGAVFVDPTTGDRKKLLGGVDESVDSLDVYVAEVNEKLRGNDGDGGEEEGVQEAAAAAAASAPAASATTPPVSSPASDEADVHTVDDKSAMAEASAAAAGVALTAAATAASATKGVDHNAVDLDDTLDLSTDTETGDDKVPAEATADAIATSMTPAVAGAAAVAAPIAASKPSDATSAAISDEVAAAAAAAVGDAEARNINPSKSFVSNVGTPSANNAAAVSEEKPNDADYSLGVSKFADVSALDDWNSFLNTMSDSVKETVKPGLDSVRKTLNFGTKEDASAPAPAPGQAQTPGPALAAAAAALAVTAAAVVSSDKAEVNRSGNEVAKDDTGAIGGAPPTPLERKSAPDPASKDPSVISPVLSEDYTEAHTAYTEGSRTIDTAPTLSTAGQATAYTIGTNFSYDDKDISFSSVASGVASGAARKLMTAFNCAGNDTTLGPDDLRQTGTVSPGVLSASSSLIGSDVESTKPSDRGTDEVTDRFLKEVMEEGIPLLLHQPPNPNSSSPGNDWTQKTVRIFIKLAEDGSGSPLPKLIWARNKALAPTRIKSGSTPDSKSGDKIRWTSVDLLSIHSILGASESDQHPVGSPMRKKENEVEASGVATDNMAAAEEQTEGKDEATEEASTQATTESCFFTVTSGKGDVHVFEAMTPEERDRVAGGLRSVVSGLVYDLITGTLGGSAALIKGADTNSDDAADIGELPSLRTSTQAMNDITHAFLD